MQADIRWRPVQASVLAALLYLTHPVKAAADPPGGESQAHSVADMSIEELMNVEVISLSKKAQRLGDSAAAVFVISAEDIHRSGASSLPEILRLAPGVDVAWIGGDAYSVSIRGFSGRFSNKLLVLRDGRSLYTSLYAGVFWERETPMLEDIERIEIIRGPGAAIWGANAVNGVINIITRSAHETTGGVVTAAGGNDGQARGEIRYGAALGEHSALRAFARGAQSNPGSTLAGVDSPDHVHDARGGVRYDLDSGPSRLTVQGELYSAASNEVVMVPTAAPPYSGVGAPGMQFSGGFALLHADQQLSAGSSLSAQMSFDHSLVNMPSFVEESRNVLSGEAQYHQRVGERHDFVVGVSVRSDADSIIGSTYLQFTPPSMRRDVSSVLAQDDIALLSERMHVIAGAILEHDTVAGTHAMPDLRLTYSLSANSTLWAAMSQAIRSPSRAELDVRYILGPTVPAMPPYLPLPVIPIAVGVPTFGVERETALQVGYRVQPLRTLSIDLTAFESRYSELRAGNTDFVNLIPSQLFGEPYLAALTPIANAQRAVAQGIESAVDWRICPWWRLQWTGAYLDITSPLVPDYEGITTNSPKFTTNLRSSMDLGPVRLDVIARHVGARLLNGLEAVPIAGYTTADVRLAWQPVTAVEVALDGHNLLTPHHLEYISDNISTAPRETDRTYRLGVLYRF